MSIIHDLKKGSTKMAHKTTNNLNSKFSLKELKILAESMKDSKLNEPYLLVLHRDKRTMTKKEKEGYSTRCIESYCTSVIDNIFTQPNVSTFYLYGGSHSKYRTYFAEGKRSNLSAIFTVDTTEKDSKYFRSTYRVKFKDKESLMIGLRIYTTLTTQSKDKILRRQLREYFNALALL